MKFSKFALIVATILSSGLLPEAALASVSYSGSTTGTWSAPVLSGNVYDGATGAVTFEDDTANAACNLAACPTQLTGYGSSTLAWGDYPFIPAPAYPTSVVTFTPSNFTNVAPNTDFAIGSLTYLNGTSADIIFGATLTIGVTLTNDPSVVTPFVIVFGIGTTTNSGTDAQNADLLDFKYALGGVKRVSFNVKESSTATAILYGHIIGDPVLQGDRIAIAPGSESAGFIGNGVPSVPEPAPVALMALGLAALGFGRRRARSKSA